MQPSDYMYCILAACFRYMTTIRTTNEGVARRWGEQASQHFSINFLGLALGNGLKFNENFLVSTNSRQPELILRISARNVSTF
jgi:hypothetical protein